MQQETPSAICSVVVTVSKENPPIHLQRSKICQQLTLAYESNLKLYTVYENGTI